MMIRAAICDDETTALNYLYEQISKEFAAQGAEISLDKFSAGKDFLDANKAEPYDVVFLDIRMPDISGFDVAAELRKLSEKVYIIFITTENTLVYDSFSFQPFDFIPKTPPSELSSDDSSSFLLRRVSNVIARLLSRISTAKTVCLPLPYNQKIAVNISDIQMIQSVRNYAEYVIAEHEPVRIRAKLDDIESGLDRRLFARPHKSYIINMDHIKDIDSSNMIVKMKSGVIIPISKAYKHDFEAAYINFLSDFGR